MRDGSLSQCIADLQTLQEMAGPDASVRILIGISNTGGFNVEPIGSLTFMTVERGPEDGKPLIVLSPISMVAALEAKTKNDNGELLR